MKRPTTPTHARPVSPEVEQPLAALSALFRNSRIQAGLDLATLAANAFVSIETVTLLETAPQTVRLEEIYAIANALNLDPGIVLDRLHSVIR